MRTAELVHRGVHSAVGLILDPQMAGSEEAAVRVIERWHPGCRLYELPDGRWFLQFASPTNLHSRDAKGTIVLNVDGGLTAAPGKTAESGELTYWSHGAVETVLVSSLPTLDPSDWIVLESDVTVLQPLVPPRSVQKVISPTPPPPTPDFRQKAAIGGVSKQSQKFMAEMQRVGGVRNGSAGRGSGSGGRSVRRRPSRDALTRLALRSPLKGQIGRRHARYLEQLSNQFTRGDIGEALRHAIPLGGLGHGGLTLRLPGRRDSLQLTGGARGGGSIPFGPTVQKHLIDLYRRAATELEAAGRIDEAAFVLSELLNSHPECVALLERHRQYGLAATVAETHIKEPALAVRLWWLAGDQARAMRLARKTHSYDTVLKYLDQNDPEAAHRFRLLWVDELERNGNLHGAIAVGWPDRKIRPLLANVVERGIAANDEWSLGLQAYRVALQPSVSNREKFLNDMNLAAGGQSLRFMAVALDQAEPVDPVADRQICTAALRVLLTRSDVEGDRKAASAFKSIKNRADPLVVADLPAVPRSSANSPSVAIGGVAPGSVTPQDVVPLSNGRVLVALGELGVRLLTSRGTTASEWSVPCHGLVPADHGKSVILLTDRAPVSDAHILDLVTSKVRYYGTIRSRLRSSSFDGSSWAVVDKRGIAFYDMLSDAPAIAWRELESHWSCYSLERSGDELAAVITIPPDAIFPDQRLELWCWELPKMRLKERKKIDPIEDATQLHLLSDATSIWERETSASIDPFVVSPRGPQPEHDLTDVTAIQTSGEYVATRRADGTLRFSRGVGGEHLASWDDPGVDWGFRVFRSNLVAWTHDGKIALVDLENRRLTTLLSMS